MTLAKGGECFQDMVQTADDHGVQSRPRCGLEGRLESLLHLHQVKEGAHHAIDTGQVLGTGPRPGLVQGQGQGVDTGTGRPDLSFGDGHRLPGGVPSEGRLVGTLLGPRHDRHQRLLFGLADREVTPQAVRLTVEQS